MAHTLVVNSYYGLSRENWQMLATLISRVKVSVPSLASLPKQFSKNRWYASVIDQLYAAVASLDHQSPSKLYDRRNIRYDRDIVNQLTMLEGRITALGL
jgi:hypothetical protein